MALSNRYSRLERRALSVIEWRFHVTPRTKASGNSCKNLKEIKRSDQKLWPFRTGTLFWSNETSASPSGDSTSTPRTTASGNSCKTLREIKRSDQKLWPSRTDTLVSSDETPASPSSDSTSTPRKTASGNSKKIWGRSNGPIKSYSPFKPVHWSRATRTPPHRVAIPHLV